MIKYWTQFLKKLEAFDLYLIKFYKNSFIEKKVYFSDYIINNLDKKPVILITYNKSTFLIKNEWHQAWLKKIDVFLYLKRREKEIIISDFWLL